MSSRRYASGSIFHVASALALVLTLAVSGLLSDPASVRATARPSGGAGGQLAWLDLGADLASFLPAQALLQAIGSPQAINDGGDGRLTFLVLGSDTRTTGLSRTDTIMVVSLKYSTGKINAASIPRDTARILNPFTSDPNDTFSGRVNGIAKLLKKSSPSIPVALDKFEIVIEKLLGTPANPIQIDYWVLVTFNGFHALVEEVDPIAVDIAKVIKDPKYYDDPNKIKGVYFPKATNYDLFAWEPNVPSKLCNGEWRNQVQPPSSAYWCHRAMPFVRSRKGPSNSDFSRAMRQQNFIGGTIEKVILDGDGAALTSLRNRASGQVSAGGLHTNFPFGNLADALALYNALEHATLGQQVVFRPTTYSTKITGTSAYELKLPAVRAWADQYLR